MATTRLFYKDPYQTEFSATIVEVSTRKHENKTKPTLVLDATLFYATSGKNNQISAFV